MFLVYMLVPMPGRGFGWERSEGSHGRPDSVGPSEVCLCSLLRMVYSYDWFWVSLYLLGDYFQPT